MDLWVREARLFKYGSGTGSNFSKLRGDGEQSLGRRPLLRPDELPEDRRPRRRRHQVGRHHAPRREDGDRRSRPSGYRGLHQLEGRSRSRRWPRWSPAPALCNLHLNKVMQGRPCRRRRGPLRPEEEPGAEGRDPRRAQGDGPGELHPARHPLRRAGLSTRSTSRPTTPIGIREAYLTVSGQNSNNSVRVSNDFIERGGERRRLEPDPPHRRQGPQDRSRRATCGRRSATPPGPAPIPASSSTPPSTSGTPARNPAASTRPIRARNTCSWTTRPATWPRST